MIRSLVTTLVVLVIALLLTTGALALTALGWKAVAATTAFCALWALIHAMQKDRW